jgi:hypothetical protein
MDSLIVVNIEDDETGYGPTQQDPIHKFVVSCQQHTQTVSPLPSIFFALGISAEC